MKIKLLIFSTIILFMTSCDKDEIIKCETDDEPAIESLLTSKTWFYKIKTYPTPSSGYTSYTYCYFDNHDFETNGDYTHHVCDYFSIGNWEWIEFDKSFKFEQFYLGELHKLTYTILEMNDTILSVKIEEDGEADYSEYKYSGKRLTFEEWRVFLDLPSSP